jgi:hypothetical protein
MSAIRKLIDAAKKAKGEMEICDPSWDTIDELEAAIADAEGTEPVNARLLAAMREIADFTASNASMVPPYEQIARRAKDLARAAIAEADRGGAVIEESEGRGLLTTLREAKLALSRHSTASDREMARKSIDVAIAEAERDGSCDCNCASPCPLARSGSETRCTTESLAHHFGVEMNRVLDRLHEWQSAVDRDGGGS